MVCLNGGGVISAKDVYIASLIVNRNNGPGKILVGGEIEMLESPEKGFL